MPECRFVSPGRLTLRDRYDIPPMRELADAVAQHARVRIDRGDLAAAWDDVVLLIRMAHQVGQGALSWPGLTSLAIERTALDLAIDWANARGQTPDRLRGALTAYLALPRMIPAAEVIRAEGVLIERTIDLPRGDFKDFVAATMTEGTGRPPGIDRMLFVDLMTTPWELARARRINRLVIDEAIRLSALEPWQRPATPNHLEAIASSGEADRFVLNRVLGFQPGAYQMTEDSNEVVRRALVQVLAMRDWVLRHDGKFPAELKDLVPSELPALPVNPYSGRSFGYTTLAQVPVPEDGLFNLEAARLAARDPADLQHWVGSRRRPRCLRDARPRGLGRHRLPRSARREEVTHRHAGSASRVIRPASSVAPGPRILDDGTRMGMAHSGGRTGCGAGRLDDEARGRGGRLDRDGGSGRADDLARTGLRERAGTGRSSGPGRRRLADGRTPPRARGHAGSGRVPVPSCDRPRRGQRHGPPAAVAPAVAGPDPAAATNAAGGPCDRRHGRSLSRR